MILALVLTLHGNKVIEEISLKTEHVQYVICKEYPTHPFW